MVLSDGIHEYSKLHITLQKKHQMKSGDRGGQLHVVKLLHYSYQKPQATFAPLSESLRSILHPNINLSARIVFSNVNFGHYLLAHTFKHYECINCITHGKTCLSPIIGNGLQPLTIITKRSILDLAAALDPPLISNNFSMKSVVLACTKCAKKSMCKI